MEFADTKALVIGTGISGLSAVSLLERKGAQVILFDANEKLKCADVKAKLKADSQAQIVIGTLPEDLLDTVDLVIPSPGVPMDIPMMLEIRRREIPVWGEIELGYRCGQGSIAAITGTNGKTTTTTLVGQILKNYNPHTYVVGNIGMPYADVADGMEPDAMTAAEISSFMLESIVEFHPKVSAILNITPDHLNRHHTMECYIAVNESITSNQTEEDTCVLNYDDKVLREFGQSEELKPKVIFFSSRQKLDDGYYLDGDMIYYAKNKKAEAVLDVRELNLLGRHNYENVMAAIAISRAMGVPMETIVKVAKEFKAVEHRIEFVLERSGVKYYNDSKGTNPDAAIQAIRAMPGPTLLIAGGYDKQSTYDEWIEAFDGKVKYLVLIGQTRDKIKEAAERLGVCPCILCENLEEAVKICAEKANPGDAVLLSPACASWGQFDNYEQRGDMFKEYVRAL